jgi:Secretion system C-terminal sorting domain
MNQEKSVVLTKNSTNNDKYYITTIIMMRRKLQFILSTILFLNSLQAQITVTSASFPAVGDTLRTTFDALPGNIDILSPGGDKVWDFTSLAGINQQTVVRAANTGTFFSSFPIADVLLGEPGGNTGELYYNKTANVYELLGYVGPDPANFGINILARMVPSLPERRAMQFLDVHDPESDIQVTFSADLIPGNIIDSFPLSPDSIRFLIAIDRLDVVDAWGELSIPGGTFPVLKEKRFEERETRMEVLVGIGPFAQWFDVTDLIGLDFLGKDTTLTHHFYSNTEKEAIAIVTVDPLTQDAINVTYKSLQNQSTGVNNYVDRGKADIFAYPNPAVNDVRFDFINLANDTYELKIFNILGVEVFRKRYVINDRLTVKMDLSNMRKGTYLYSLVNSKGKPITTKRLVVMKP